MYIRTRLTLWFLLILALVLAAFGLALYQFTRTSLLAEVDRDVQQRAAAIAAVARPAPDQLTLRIPPLDIFQAPDTYMQIVDASGRVLARSGNLGQRTLPVLVGRLRSILYEGVPVALLLAAVAVWLLTRRALRPLEHLSGTAAAIAAAQDHTRRVHAVGPSDEIRRLARTINGMLQALEDAYRKVQEVND